MADIYNMSDVFISYSRRDSEFMHRVFDAFKAKDKEVWADFEDIPKAADWWQEIEAGIEAADSFVFIISPDSVRSEICYKEVQHAVDNNKRLLPVLYREVTEKADQEKMHPAISAHNWIFIREDDDFDGGFATLLTAVETDLDHNRTLTRLLVRAREWKNNDRHTSYLLQGEDLQQADTWLAQSMDKNPHPTQLHVEYINASRERASNQQRRLLSIVSGALVVMVVLVIFAIFQMNDARIARDQAQQAAIEASSLALAAGSTQALFNNDPDLSLALGLDAIALDDRQPQVIKAMADSAYAAGTRQVIDTGDEQLFTVAYSPNSRLYASGDRIGQVCLWYTEDDSLAMCLEAHEHTIVSIDFTDDSDTMLTAAEEDTLRLWDANPDSETFGDEIGAYTCEPVNDADWCAITSAAFFPDSMDVLMGLEDGRVIEWLPDTDETRTLADVHEGGITALTISPSGLRALTGDTNGLAVHWNLRQGEAIHTYLDEASEGFTSVAFSNGGQLGAYGTMDGVIFVWNLLNGDIFDYLFGHEETVTGIAFSPEEDVIFSTSWDNSIRAWNINNSSTIRTYYGHRGGINDLALAPDGRTLVTASFDTEVRVWDVHHFLMIERIPLRHDWINDTDYEDADGYFVTGHRSGDVLIHDARTRETLRTYRGYGEEVVGIDMSADGVYLAALFTDGRLMVRDVEQNRRIWNKLLSDEIPASEMLGVTFSHDGSFIMLGTEDGIGWWDLESRELSGYLPHEGDDRNNDAPILSFALHPDDSRVLVGLNDVIDNLYMLDMADNSVTQEYEGHDDGILSMDFNPDGTQVVTGAFDNDVRVWDVETGEPVTVFSGHSDRVTSVSYSPENETVVSASNDRTVRLWDVRTGFEVYTYYGHTARITSLHFSENGRTVLSGARDNDVILWRLPHRLNDLLDWTRDNRYVRQLTCIERNLYKNAAEDCTLEG